MEVNKPARVVRTYSDDQKRFAAMQYSLLGSPKLTSKATGIPETTIWSWANGNSDVDGPFLSYLEEARTQRQTEFIAKYEASVEAALDLMAERLSDERTTAKDLATIAAIMQDKALLLSNKPTSIRANQGVQELADMFIKLSRSQQAIEHKNNNDLEDDKGPIEG